MSTTVPLPSNSRRMTWEDVPAEVVDAIAAQAGATVASANGATFGFSPGFAGVVTFADGKRTFLKVMSAERDPWSIDINRREAEILAALPPEVPAAALLWMLELEPWLVFATEAVDGDHPSPATDAGDAAVMWDVMTHLATVPAPAHLPPFHEYQHDVLDRWQTLASTPDRDARLASLGADGEWVATHLDSLLTWEREAIDASKGDALVHGDLRADNVLVAESRAVIVDWPHAARGAAWLDLAAYLPSFEMNGGGSAAKAFRAHPLSHGVSVAHELAIVAALAGYFTVMSTEPPAPPLPGLREFQRAQATPALNWLRELAQA